MICHVHGHYDKSRTTKVLVRLWVSASSTQMTLGFVFVPKYVFFQGAYVLELGLVIKNWVDVAFF
jgi:hypothetical protein